MRKTIGTEVKVGLFVTLGVALTLLAILLLGGTDSFFSKPIHYTTHFRTVEGLITGARVVLGGLPVGKVEKIEFDSTNREVKVSINVASKYIDWVRKDSTVEMMTQGVLGDKYVSISTGNPDQPTLPDGSEIANVPTKNFAEVLGRGDRLLNTLNSISASVDHLMKALDEENENGGLFKNMGLAAKHMAQASEKLNKQFEDMQLKKVGKNLNAVLEKMNSGTGTLGALINDPSLYDEARALVGGANRNKLMRNLVRKTVKEGDEAEAKKTAEKNAASGKPPTK